MTFYFVVKSGKHLVLADILRCVYHALLFLVFTHFVIYIVNATKLERPRSTLYEAAAIAMLLTVVGVDVWTTVQSGGITVTESGMTFRGRNIFLLWIFRVCGDHRAAHPGAQPPVQAGDAGLFGAMAISFTVLLIQGLFGQTSFTVSTFMYPVVAMFYIMHSNPYDAVLGAIDSGALNNYVHYHYEKRKDFLLMKSKISDLRAQGIKIYLDDFGTGYSNMERIMELPFDIIKFDRYLVIASGENPRSEKLVESLASMFASLDYSVLYEGVESESDEKMCREMRASYLQGYKYSRPIPIENLEAYFEKVVA